MTFPQQYKADLLNAIDQIDHVAAGTIKPEEKTVLVLTGSGLKATQKIGEILGA